MLIIEGPDCVGKTTLAKQLLEYLPRHIYTHFTRLPEGFDYYWDYVDRMSRYIIQDRFHLSEVVYSTAIGRECRLDELTYGMIDAKLRMLGGMVVLITADADLIEQRWDKSQMFSLDKTLIAADKYNRIYRQYLYQRRTPYLLSSTSSFSMQIDFAHKCTAREPYVGAHIGSKILEMYCERQRHLDDILGRTPASL